MALKANPDALRAGAAHFNGASEAINGIARRLDSFITDMVSGSKAWKSEAANDFHTAYHHDRAKWDALAKMLNQRGRGIVQTVIFVFETLRCLQVIDPFHGQSVKPSANIHGYRVAFGINAA